MFSFFKKNAVVLWLAVKMKSDFYGPLQSPVPVFLPSNLKSLHFLKLLFAIETTDLNVAAEDLV